MANVSKRAVARLIIQFYLTPDKVFSLKIDRVNPDSDLAALGHAIVPMTNYRHCPYELATEFG